VSNRKSSSPSSSARESVTSESREPNKERLESIQIQIDEVRDQNEHIELTEEREEGEVIDSENENESKKL
jgi:hypothetical protein